MWDPVVLVNGNRGNAGVNPFGASNPFPILIPSNFLRKIVSSFEGVKVWG